MSDDQRPTAQETGNAAAQGCLLLIVALLLLALFAPVMNVIAPLDQVGQNEQVQQIGDGR